MIFLHLIHCHQTHESNLTVFFWKHLQSSVSARMMAQTAGEQVRFLGPEEYCALQRVFGADFLLTISGLNVLQVKEAFLTEFVFLDISSACCGQYFLFLCMLLKN